MIIRKRENICRDTERGREKEKKRAERKTFLTVLSFKWFNELTAQWTRSNKNERATFGRQRVKEREEKEKVEHAGAEVRKQSASATWGGESGEEGEMKRAELERERERCTSEMIRKLVKEEATAKKGEWVNIDCTFHEPVMCISIVETWRTVKLYARVVFASHRVLPMDTISLLASIFHEAYFSSRCEWKVASEWDEQEKAEWKKKKKRNKTRKRKKTRERARVNEKSGEKEKRSNFPREEKLTFNRESKEKSENEKFNRGHGVNNGEMLSKARVNKWWESEPLNILINKNYQLNKSYRSGIDKVTLLFAWFSLLLRVSICLSFYSSQITAETSATLMDRDAYLLLTYRTRRTHHLKLLESQMWPSDEPNCASVSGGRDR